MGQSNNIALALIAGFVVYITVRGELPAYLCVIGIGSGCVQPNPQPTVSTQNKPPVQNQPQQSQQNAPPRNSGGGGGGSDPGNVFTSIDGNWPYSSIGVPNDPLDTSNAGIPDLQLPELPAPEFPAPPGTVDTSITYDTGSPTYGDEDYDPYTGFNGTYEGGL